MAVRDPTEQDPGACDQRLLAVEPEFASVLKRRHSRDLDAFADAARRVGLQGRLQLLTRTASGARDQRAHLA